MSATRQTPTPRTFIATTIDRDRLGAWNVLRSTRRCRCCGSVVPLDTLLVSRDDAVDLIEWGFAVLSGLGRLKPRAHRSVDDARQALALAGLDKGAGE